MWKDLVFRLLINFSINTDSTGSLSDSVYVLCCSTTHKWIKAPYSKIRLECEEIKIESVSKSDFL